MSATFTRLTVVGQDRRADLAVPDDEVFAASLPRMLDLLGERPGPVNHPLRLVRPTGAWIDLTRSPAEQQVLDGEVVRIVRAQDAPHPPEVADITDVLGDEHARRQPWSQRNRLLGTGAALGLVGTLAAAMLPAATTSICLVGIGGLVVIAGAIGRLGRAGRVGAVLLTSVGLGLGASTAVRLGLSPNSTATGWVLPVLTAAGLIGWTTVGVGIGLGTGRRDVVAGSALGLGLAGAQLGLANLGGPRAAAVVAMVAVALAGFLPRYAAVSSRLMALDAQMTDGRLRPRRDLQRRIAMAFGALTWSVVAVATSLAATTGVLLTAHDPWAIGVGASTIVVTALRTRAFPVAGQRLALGTAAGCGLVVGVVGQDRLGPGVIGAGLLVVAVAVAAGGLITPAEHTQAAWRAIGDAVEATVVVATVPLLFGLFGVYHDLLAAFGR